MPCTERVGESIVRHIRFKIARVQLYRPGDIVAGSRRRFGNHVVLHLLRISGNLVALILPVFSPRPGCLVANVFQLRIVFKRTQSRRANRCFVLNVIRALGQIAQGYSCFFTVDGCRACSCNLVAIGIYQFERVWHVFQIGPNFVVDHQIGGKRRGRNPDSPGIRVVGSIEFRCFPFLTWARTKLIAINIAIFGLDGHAIHNTWENTWEGNRGLRSITLVAICKREIEAEMRSHI